MKTVPQLLFSFILSLFLATHAYGAYVDFSSLSPGDSIEGLGTVHPLLSITSSQGSAVALFEGVSPSSYGAPNGEYSMRNGNISSDGGFGDISPNRLHDFVFTFTPGISINDFSLRMLDYGDLNPGGATQHTVALIALNGNGNTVDQFELNYTSDSASNPTSGSAGNLYLTGDAMTASFGEPGNYLFSVSGQDITEVKLLYSHNGMRVGPSDPNIAFDSLNITFVPIPGSATLLFSGISLIFGIANKKKIFRPNKTN